MTARGMRRGPGRLGTSCLALVLWLAATSVLAGEAARPLPEEMRRAIAREVEAGNIGTAADALAGYEAEGVRLDGREELLLGVLLVRLGRHADAVARLDRAAGEPLLGDYALYHLAAALRAEGDARGAADALHRLLERHARSLFTERAGREVTREWLDAGELAKAEAAAGRYLSAVRNGPGVAAVWLTVAEVMVLTGRFEAAEQILRRIWVELPGSPDSERAQGWLAVLDAKPFTADERFLRASTLHRLGRHAQAVAELAPFAVPGDPREARARLSLGISAFNLRQYAQAARWLLPLRDVPGPDRGEALFWLGRSAGRSGDGDGFTDSLTRLADALPDARRAEEGLYLLAQWAADDGEPAKARGYLARLLKRYPRTVWKDGALWLDGWLAFRQGEPKAALAAWDRLVAEEPTSRLRVAALYWRGRVLETAGKRAEAARAYLATVEAAEDQPYYRMRATTRLTRLGKKPPVRRPAQAVTTARPSAAPDRLHADKARALRDLGLVEEAVDEYREQATVAPDDRAALGEACRAFLDLERYERALWLGRRLLVPLFLQDRGKLPIRDFWTCLYPLAHPSTVSDAAKAHGLDPLFVTALMREESSFAPRAVSGAGARGLMQVMPHTAQRIAREQGLPAEAANLDSPEWNIRLGTAHLAELVRSHRGNLALMLAAYNAGGQPVQRWLERIGFADEEAFIEDIPYAETRNYVKRVLGTYHRYRELYEKNGS